MQKRFANSGQREYRIAALDRAVAVLMVFEGGRELSQREVARAVGISEATALRYLFTLARHDLVEREPSSGRYRMGWRLFRLAESALTGRDPRDAAMPFIRRLVASFNETVNLAARRSNDLIIIAAIEGSHSLKRGASVGEQDAWHASAIGKAILALLDEEEADHLVGPPPYKRYTAKTVLDRDALMDELAEVRRQGYAVDNEEGEEGLRCLGIAILDRQGKPSYALSISGPSSRLTTDVTAQMARDLHEAAAGISKHLGSAGPDGLSR
jgi:DNA-binding IclR family transcriptional regulator